MSDSSPDAATAVARQPDPYAGDDLQLLDPRKVGMACFLCSEAAFFTTLLVAYGLYIGQDTSGPTPAAALSLPLVSINTLLLLSSSGTIAAALNARQNGRRRACCTYLGFTILLGSLFLLGTGVEWQALISDHGLTLSRNLFGSTFFTLLGFHATHVGIGLILLLTVLILEARACLPPDSSAPELVGWYWHFVDGVWVVVFGVVYVLGR